jgi:RNA polymerase sigma factor (sigma-70 family)
MAACDEDFAIFYKSAAERVSLFALSICGNVSDAEDATQEAFIGTYRNWSALKHSDDSERMAYVFRAARNRAVSLYRFRRRMSELHDRLIRRCPVKFVHVEEEALRNDAVQAIRRLPKQQRAVALLLWVEEMTVSEVAAILQISDKAVRTHRDRARRKLTPEFTDETRSLQAEGGTM